MERVKFVLSVWTKLATHIRMRDRSVKILQYGCQMLLGFYASKFSAEVVECLRLTKAAASTSRKAFWLLKSINHIGTLIEMLECYNYAKDEGFANFFDILEQLSLIVYYWYENLVFLSRMKLIATAESSLDTWGNPSWFIEDLTCFVAAFIRTVLNFRKLRNKQNDLKLMGVAEESTVQNRSATATTETSSVEHKRKILKEINALHRQFWDSFLSVIIALFEVGASGEAVHAWRPFLGYDIGDKGMGMCGVISSTLILADGCMHAIREAYPDDEMYGEAVCANEDADS